MLNRILNVLLILPILGTLLLMVNALANIPPELTNEQKTGWVVALIIAVAVAMVFYGICVLVAVKLAQKLREN